MKKYGLMLLFMVLVGLVANAQMQGAAIKYLGKCDSKELWDENVAEWRRTLGGPGTLINQVPKQTIKLAVDYLFYVRDVEDNDVWIVGYPQYTVYLWIHDGKYYSLSFM